MNLLDELHNLGETPAEPNDFVAGLTASAIGTAQQRQVRAQHTAVVSGIAVMVIAIVIATYAVIHGFGSNQEPTPPPAPPSASQSAPKPSASAPSPGPTSESPSPSASPTEVVEPPVLPPERPTHPVVPAPEPTVGEDLPTPASEPRPRSDRVPEPVDPPSPSITAMIKVPANPPVVTPAPPVDSDGDGLDDDTERLIGTDPNNPDTDGDRLDDRREHVDLGTDPLKADTDDDGYDDAWEVEVATNPNSAPDNPMTPINMPVCRAGALAENGWETSENPAAGEFRAILTVANTGRITCRVPYARAVFDDGRNHTIRSEGYVDRTVPLNGTSTVGFIHTTNSHCPQTPGLVTLGFFDANTATDPWFSASTPAAWPVCRTKP